MLENQTIVCTCGRKCYGESDWLAHKIISGHVFDYVVKLEPQPSKVAA